MTIDKNKLKKEILDLSRELYRTKSYTDFKNKYYTLEVLSEVYQTVGDDILEIIVPNNEDYARLFARMESALDYNLDAYFDDRKFHSSLSGKVLGTYNRTGFHDAKGEYRTTKVNKINKLELINDFLSDYDKRVQKEFNFMHMNNLIETESEYVDDAQTYFIFDKNKSYIIVPSCNNLFDIDVLMHELGHAYTLRVLESRGKKQALEEYKSYYELYPMHMELSFQEYLKRNGMKRDSILIENNYLSFMYYYFSFLRESAKFNDDETLDISNMNYIKNAFIYSYAYYIALLLHEKNSDKDSLKSRFDDFLSYQGLIDYDKQLEILGLTKDGLKDMKVLKKKISVHTSELEKL